MKTLYILDCHALIYRAYYAFQKNKLTSKSGQPTGAVYGFTQYLLRIIKDYNPQHMVAVMDSGHGSIYRETIYPEYKQTRSPMPSDLVSQLPIIREILRAFDIPILMENGIEADDIIASLVENRDEGLLDCVIVSKDKDLMQLIDKHVTMLAPNGNGFEVIDKAYVIAKFGVRPDQLHVFLALVGDTSDNIPGVTGYGPKKAASLINQGFVTYISPEFELSLKLVTLRPMLFNMSVNEYVYDYNIEPSKELIAKLLLSLDIKTLEI